MALARTDHLNELFSDTAGAYSVVSGAFTPPDNSLLVVCFSGVNVGQFGTATTVSGASLTWTRGLTVTTTGGGGYYEVFEIWTAPVTTGVSMTVTVDNAVTASDGRGMIQSFSYTGYDTGTPTGGFVASSTLAGAGTGTGAMTLSAAPASDDITVAARYFVPATAANPTATPGSGWTEVYEGLASSGYGSTNVEVRTASTSTAVAWTEINDAAIALHACVGGALVIKAAAAAAGQPTIKRMGGVRFAATDYGTW